MKLWKISQDKNNDLDTYDSAVVAADTESEAKMMNPLNGKDIKPEPYSSWVGDPTDVQCEYIGEAKNGTQKGVVCASYNAG
jgi:hypothetical protein